MENKRLYGRMCYLQREMSRENSYLFSEYGITPVHFHVLVFVLKSGNEGRNICQKDIEREINIRASSVSSLLSTLEKNEFITRTVSDGDARTKYVNLTEKARSLCEKNKLLMDRCDSLLQSALTEEEQYIFNELLNKIIAKIENPDKEVK